PDACRFCAARQVAHTAFGRLPSSSPPGKVTHSCVVSCVVSAAMPRSLRARRDRTGHGPGVRSRFSRRKCPLEEKPHENGYFLGDVSSQGVNPDAKIEI